jgi:thiamine monophosphate synthase
MMKEAVRPVVAIGGITLERLPALIPTGVAMVAVVSDILTGRIADRVAAYRAALRSLAS